MNSKKIYMVLLVIAVMSSVTFAIAPTMPKNLFETAVQRIDKVNLYPYPYYDYPRVIVFKGVAVTKDYESYPAIFIATDISRNTIDTWPSNGRYYFILDGEIHKLTLNRIIPEKEKGLVISEFNENSAKKLILTARYTRYRNDILLSGVYDKKYLLNMNLAQNEIIYRILEKSFSEVAEEDWIPTSTVVTETTEKDDSGSWIE